MLLAQHLLLDHKDGGGKEMGGEQCGPLVGHQFHTVRLVP